MKRSSYPMLELRRDVSGRWVARCAELGLEVSATTSEEAGATLIALVAAAQEQVAL